MSSVNTSQRPSLKVGRVLYVFPELNIYAVEPRDGLVYSGNVAYEFAIDVSAHSCTSRIGVTDGSSYAPGAEVLMMSLAPDEPDAGKEQNLEQGIYNFIMGPSYHLPLTNSEVFADQILDDPFIDMDNNKVRYAISKGIKAWQMIQDRSFGRSSDATAGDFIKTNLMGGQIKLTMMRAVLGGSAGSFIRMNGLDDSMDLVAEKFSFQGSAVHNTEYPSWDYYNKINRYARTMSEGLGAYDTPFKTGSESGDYEFLLQKDDQQGIFRQVGINGVLVEGSYDLILAPEKQYTGGSVRQIANTAEPQFGMSAIHRTYDGTVDIQGVKNVGMTRSAYVWAPRELDMEDNNPVLNSIIPDELEPDTDWSSKVTISEETRADYASLMKDARTEHKLERYFKNIEGKADSDMNIWKTYSKTDVQSKYGDIVDVETKLDPLKDSEDAYETTPSVKVPDPLRPDEEIKLQALLSCIELDETGAVIIHDGYGSEIKMHRGHITVAPAADLKIRPGRSVISLAPRDTVLRSRQYTEVSSDENDVMIKSQRDMKLLSGNGDQGGQLILENRGTTPFKAGDREDETRPSGIAIKSHKGDLSMVSPNMYIGLLAPSDASPEGRAGASNGLLTVDAGRGTMSMSGRSLIGSFLGGVAYVVNQASMMSVDASGVVLAGANLGVACPTVKYGSPTAVPTYPEVTERGVETKTLNIPGGDVTLQIAGRLEVPQAEFSDNIKADLVSANTVIAQDGSFGNASDTSGLIGGKGPGNIGGDDISVNTGTIAGVLREVSASMRASVLAESGFTGYGILYSGFFYQQDNKYDTGDIVEARYQRMLRKGGSAKQWKTEGAENVDKPEGGGDVTAPWPGIEATQSVKTISDDGLSSEDLGVFDEAYVINTEK